MHALVSHTLANALATAGTVAIAYPAGTTKGDFVFGSKHKIVALQYTWQAPRDFTITLGDSTFTVTWKAAATLPAGTALRVQLDKPGVVPGVEEGPRKRLLAGAVSAMALMMISLGTPVAADPNGYVESQDLTAAGVFSVSTTAAAAIAAAALKGQADVPRNVVAAWTTEAVITITGEDKYGNTMVEKSASGTSFTGKKAFYKVTGVSVSANVTALTVGTGDVLGLPVFVPDASMVFNEYFDGAVLPRNAGRVYIPFFYAATQMNAATGWFFNSPVKGRIVGLRTAVEIAFTTGGAITVLVNGVAVDGLSVAVGTEAADELDSDAATAGHASAIVNKGDLITIQAEAAFDSAGAVNGVLEIEVDPIDQLNGTLVVGSTVEPTATSGDVRGTYAPATVPDGSNTYGLIVALPDPGYLGGAQYAG